MKIYAILFLRFLLTGGSFMATSDSQLKAIAKYDKENYQHISFKARIGSRDRIKEAAEATGQSVNGFIKTAISNAVMESIGKPLESTEVEYKDELKRNPGKTTAIVSENDMLPLLDPSLSNKDRRQALNTLKRKAGKEPNRNS